VSRVRDSLRTKLESALAPTRLEILDESASHNVPPGAESHFRVRVVSPLFRGERLLARHRRVHAAVAEELAGSVHALALETLTPEEDAASPGTIGASPPCLGGERPGSSAS